MSLVKEYFLANRPQAKWHLGDRVYGKYQKKLFIGTVLVQHLVYEDLGQQVQVYLDLPLVVGNEQQPINLITVKPESIKRVKSF